MVVVVLMTALCVLFFRLLFALFLIFFSTQSL